MGENLWFVDRFAVDLLYGGVLAGECVEVGGRLPMVRTADDMGNVVDDQSHAIPSPSRSKP